MEWIVKALVGAAAVLLIQVLALSKSYFLAGMVPLFPTFALIAHYLVGTQRGTVELKQTIVFGMVSMIPYMVYLVTLYFMVDRYRLGWSLAGATGMWVVTAGVLVGAWKPG